MGQTAGVGHFVSRDGGCMLIGRAHAITPMHAHYAIQVAFGAQFGIRFRPSESVDWTDYAGVVIPSRQPHTMDATVVPGNVVLFIEPETREGRVLTELVRDGGITALPDETVSRLGAPLFAALSEPRNVRAALADAARRAVVELTKGMEPSAVSSLQVDIHAQRQ